MNSPNSANRLAIPVSQETQTYVESVCVNGAYTFETFFVHLLNLYKKSLNEPLRQTNLQEVRDEEDKAFEKKLKAKKLR